MDTSFFKSQVIPITLTVVICAVLIAVFALEIIGLNALTVHDILLEARIADIVVGMTIYLKTSIDFAIYIGNLMSRNNGWKSRIAIEIGTALGNAVGTMAILLVWAFFKEVKWLLAIMITAATFVLFKLAEDGLEHAEVNDARYPRVFRYAVHIFEKALEKLNKCVAPVLRYILPDLRLRHAAAAAFWPLFGLSFSVPFILGLDDFAGYVPLFSIINVFGFGIGVFAGHMLLNMLLYISPASTIRAVKNPVISLFGSIVFAGLGVWGLVEVVRLIGI